MERKKATLTLWDLIPVRLIRRILERGNTASGSDFPHPNLGVVSGSLAPVLPTPGGPAHGDSPLGYRSPEFLQLVRLNAGNLHVSDVSDWSVDRHKPASSKTVAYHMLTVLR